MTEKKFKDVKTAKTGSTTAEPVEHQAIETSILIDHDTLSQGSNIEHTTDELKKKKKKERKKKKNIKHDELRSVTDLTKQDITLRKSDIPSKHTTIYISDNTEEQIQHIQTLLDTEIDDIELVDVCIQQTILEDASHISDINLNYSDMICSSIEWESVEILDSIGKDKCVEEVNQILEENPYQNNCVTEKVFHILRDEEMNHTIESKQDVHNEISKMQNDLVTFVLHTSDEHIEFIEFQTIDDDQLIEPFWDDDDFLITPKMSFENLTEINSDELCLTDEPICLYSTDETDAEVTSTDDNATSGEKNENDELCQVGNKHATSKIYTSVLLDNDYIIDEEQIVHLPEIDSQQVCDNTNNNLFNCLEQQSQNEYKLLEKGIREHSAIDIEFEDIEKEFINYDSINEDNLIQPFWDDEDTLNYYQISHTNISVLSEKAIYTDSSTSLNASSSDTEFIPEQSSEIMIKLAEVTYQPNNEDENTIGIKSHIEQCLYFAKEYSMQQKFDSSEEIYIIESLWDDDTIMTPQTSHEDLTFLDHAILTDDQEILFSSLDDLTVAGGLIDTDLDDILAENEAKLTNNSEELQQIIHWDLVAYNDTIDQHYEHTDELTYVSETLSKTDYVGLILHSAPICDLIHVIEDQHSSEDRSSIERVEKQTTTNDDNSPVNLKGDDLMFHHCVRCKDIFVITRSILFEELINPVIISVYFSIYVGTVLFQYLV